MEVRELLTACGDACPLHSQVRLVHTCHLVAFGWPRLIRLSRPSDVDGQVTVSFRHVNPGSRNETLYGFGSPTLDLGNRNAYRDSGRHVGRMCCCCHCLLFDVGCCVSVRLNACFCMHVSPVTFFL
jgi:hypothetical protein